MPAAFYFFYFFFFPPTMLSVVAQCYWYSFCGCFAMRQKAHLEKLSHFVPFFVGTINQTRVVFLHLHGQMRDVFVLDAARVHFVNDMLCVLCM